MKFTSLSIAAALLQLLTPSSVEACVKYDRRNLQEEEILDDDGFDDDGFTVPTIPLTIRAGIVPGAIPVFLNREEDGSLSGFLMDWLDEIRCIAMENAASPYHYNVTYDFVELDGLPNVSTYNGAQATITDGCEDLEATDGVGCLDMLLGDYYITSERTQQFTFPPQPFSVEPVVGFYSTNSNTTYSTIQEVNDAGGTVCVLEDSAVGNLYAPFVDNPVLCGPNIPACAERVSAGDCDFGFGGTIFFREAQEQLPDLVLTGAPVPAGTLDEEPQFYVATPVRSSLTPEVLQNLNLWGEESVPRLIELTTEYFGEQGLIDHVTRVEEFHADRNVTLRVAIMVYAPYVYFDEDGELTGLSIEHLRAIEERSNGGLILDFTEVSNENADGVFSTPGNLYNPTGFYNDAVVALPDSPFDIIAGPFAASVARKEDAIFSFRFVWQQIGLFRLVESTTGIETLDEANAQDAGVCILDGTLVTAPKEMIISNPVVCPSVDECYNSLANGECALMVDWFLDGFANAAFAIPDVPVTFGLLPLNEDGIPIEFQDGFYYSYPLRRDLPPSTYVRYNRWVHQVRNDGSTIEDLFNEFFTPLFPSNIFEGEEMEGMMGAMGGMGVVDEDLMNAMMENMANDQSSASQDSATMVGLGMLSFLLSFLAFV